MTHPSAGRGPPPPAGPVPWKKDFAHQLLLDMLRIRRMEEKAAELYGAGKIRGFLHLYIGEEAVAVGADGSLLIADYSGYVRRLAINDNGAVFDTGERCAMPGTNTRNVFLAPDGRTVLFAYSQAAAWSKYQGKEAYEWMRKRSMDTRMSMRRVAEAILL